jgi:5-(carboxyamino)imidazole ribonucleotide synthase
MTTSSMAQFSQHIAIFGCGQLAQMTAKAGISLGHRFSFIAEEGEDSRCVDELGEVATYRKGMAAQVLFDLLGKPNAITVEKEMVDTALLDELKQLTRVAPAANAIYISQNRIREKTFLQNLGIPTANFEIIESIEHLQTLPDRLGYPIYIKAAESGYDGYHQWRIKSDADLSQTELIAAIDNNVQLIAEKHVNYSREVSVIAARNVSGDVALYPMMENRHEEGVLIATIAPAPEPKLAESALGMIKTLLIELSYVGILTVECFETEQGIVVNELAPRVHNSGHWTIEGAATSQFENHCRAITNMSLGSTEVKNFSGLVNMLGHHGSQDQLKAVNSSTRFYHAYGKEERPRRKLGHVTVCADTITSLKQSLNDVMKTLYKDRYKPL